MSERVASAVTPALSEHTIGIIGGTGEQGRGLALRWSVAGLPVMIGSRDRDRAVATAASLGANVTGGANDDVAGACTIVVIAVPWEAHATTLKDLAPSLTQGVVVDCVNPLGFDARGAFSVEVLEGSAAEQAAALLPGCSVVGAFHHLSSVTLSDTTCTSMDADVLVVGDDRAATDLVCALASAIPGVRGIYAGRLRSARQVEALTANLIAINRRYRAHASIRVTGV